MFDLMFLNLFKHLLQTTWVVNVCFYTEAEFNNDILQW